MELRSVDVEANRHRRYSILVQLGIEGGGELLVSWGRIGGRGRSRIERFSNRSDLERRYNALMARRRRHAYVRASGTTFDRPVSGLPEPAEGAVLDLTTRYVPVRQSTGYVGVFDGHLQAFVVRDADVEVATLFARALNDNPRAAATLLAAG